MKYIPVALTLLFVTYGQLIIKHGISKLGPVPSDSFASLSRYFFRALTDLGIVSGLLAAVIAAFCWMAAMSKFKLSSIYPILSLNFVLVPAFSAWIFRENLSPLQIVGIAIIVAGVITFAKGIQ